MQYVNNTQRATICATQAMKYQTLIYPTSIAVVLIYNAESINKLAMKHWKSFSTQNYFVGNGVFTSVMLSAPLLMSMFTILIMYLMESAQLLIEMKKKELLYKARMHAQESKTSSNRKAGSREGKKSL